MIRLEFNGKPFDPETFTDTIMQSLMQQAAENVRDRIGAIRDPDTGEFPTIVVHANAIDDIQCTVEGSPKLLALVNKRLNLESDSTSDNSEQAVMATPKVFLSYGGEDAAAATAIAKQLMAKGIDTWFAVWDLTSGDSLRQKIDEGIGNCTHFVALLTPRSKTKPWVNIELDSGLSRKAAGRAKMIVLRYELSAADLPPTLSGLVSPEVFGPDFDVSALINDIHGITRKPQLGPSPHAALVKRNQSTGYSLAANLIARLFVETTTSAESVNPQISREDLLEKTGLTDHDAIDALYELRNFIVTDQWDGVARPKHELYAEFDQYWMPWNPADDAMRLAADLFNDSTFPTEPGEVAVRYDWTARRLNPAISYLLSRDVLQSLYTLGSGPWIVASLYKNDDTLRRFVKNRT